MFMLRLYSLCYAFSVKEDLTAVINLALLMLVVRRIIRPPYLFNPYVKPNELENYRIFWDILYEVNHAEMFLGLHN